MPFSSMASPLLLESAICRDGGEVTSSLVVRPTRLWTLPRRCFALDPIADYRSPKLTDRHVPDSDILPQQDAATYARRATKVPFG